MSLAFKQFLFLKLILISSCVSSQPLLEQLKTVNNVEQAVIFIDNNPSLNPELLLLCGKSDTIALNRFFLKKKELETFILDTFIYKVVEKKKKLLMRASYIYLDGSKLSIAYIDSTRNVILAKYKNGVSFEKLFSEYNMDENANGGDLGYFEQNVTATEFEAAVLSHKNGDIFKVNVPDRDWYYIVKKTHKNIRSWVMRILKIKF